MEPTDRASPAQALAIYVEALVPRGVVAVIGDCSEGVGEIVLGLGARSVHVWDPDGARALAYAERAPRGIAVRPLAREDLGRRDFDLVLVPDLGLFDDPASLLAEMRRMVGEEGVVAVGARSAEGARRSEARAFDYYELFDAVAAQFDFVRMVAELPFRGVSLVELGDDADPAGGVSVDTQLGDEAALPDAFVALGSQRDVRLDPYAIVQLPPVEEPAPPDAAPVAPPLIDPEDLADLRARASAIPALEAALSERAGQMAALARQLDEARRAVEAARHAAADELDELIARVDKAERRAADLERELASTDKEGGAEEHQAIEQRLRERAQVIRELEAELARRDRMVRDLASALEDAHGSPGAPAPERPAADAERRQVADLERRLDALALDLARREGEAQAATWSRQELERRVEVAERAAAAAAPSAGPAGGAAGDAAARLVIALDEIDALRAALVQEHAARIQAQASAAQAVPEARGQDAPAGAEER